MYCLFCVVLYIVCVYMCTELLPPGGYPIAVKYISYEHIIQHNQDGRAFSSMCWPHLPQGNSLLLISVRGGVNLRATECGQKD